MKSAVLSLVLAATALAAGPFQFKEINDKSIGLWEGSKPVLVYNHGLISRPGVPARYNRACYVHPLYGLDGEVLTDDFPRDHRHHRGVFWAWPHIKIEGKEYNSWIPSGITDRHLEWLRREALDDRAIIETRNGWFVGEKKVMDEHLLIIVHRATADSRAIDFTLTWTPTDKPITLWGAKGKSYGGFTIRFNTRPAEKDRIPANKVVITVPEGVTKGDLAVKRLPWADFTAPFPGGKGPSGLLVFIHPSHPDYPPTWLTRHYGCLCVGWPGIEPKTLPPGKSVTCRYRLWLHRAQPTPQTLTKAYDQYLKETGGK